MKVGIIVGRFQVPDLTKGHRGLFSKAFNECEKLIVFIGETKNGKITPHDPLPYEPRANMIVEFFLNRYGKGKIPQIYKIVDIGDYPKWVEDLDSKIQSLMNLELIEESDDINIYGSRDSVAEKYKENGGKYKTCVVQEVGTGISGTEVRKNIWESYKPDWDKEKREFAIWLAGKLED